MFKFYILFIAILKLDFSLNDLIIKFVIYRKEFLLQNIPGSVSPSLKKGKDNRICSTIAAFFPVKWITRTGVFIAGSD